MTTQQSALEEGFKTQASLPLQRKEKVSTQQSALQEVFKQSYIKATQALFVNERAHWKATVREAFKEEVEQVVKKELVDKVSPIPDRVVAISRIVVDVKWLSFTILFLTTIIVALVLISLALILNG